MNEPVTIQGAVRFGVTLRISASDEKPVEAAWPVSGMPRIAVYDANWSTCCHFV